MEPFYGGNINGMIEETIEDLAFSSRPRRETGPL
jgi:hypothetical protein